MTGEYNTRRWQCEKAAEFFGVKALRDVSVEEFQKREAELTALNSLVAKRARHVVTENQRVLDAVEALKHNDLTKLGELMGQSHESMRDDFEITVPQIDYLVELAQLVIGKIGGARMTVVVLVAALLPLHLMIKLKKCVKLLPIIMRNKRV